MLHHFCPVCALRYGAHKQSQGRCGRHRTVFLFKKKKKDSNKNKTWTNGHTHIYIHCPTAPCKQLGAGPPFPKFRHPRTL